MICVPTSVVGLPVQVWLHPWKVQRWSEGWEWKADHQWQHHWSLCYVSTAQYCPFPFQYLCYVKFNNFSMTLVILLSYSRHRIYYAMEDKLFYDACMHSYNTNSCTLLEPHVQLLYWPWGEESVLDWKCHLGVSLTLQCILGMQMSRVW